MSEHRISKDDLVPPWYRRGAYLLIIVVIVFIVIYGAYLLVFSHPAPTPVNATLQDPYQEPYIP